MSDAVVVVDNVTRAFKDFRAVDRVSFEVQRGQIFGFIGPNGAGKTTTIRMLATLDEPDQGEITVCGCNTIDDPVGVRRALGYMPDNVGLYEGVQVWEYLEFFANAYRVFGQPARELVEEIMQLTDLVDVRTKLVSTLSKGMRQRLVLAKTLLHDPEVLVLDEPAAGLDPHARIWLRSLLKELRGMGKTIIISSHILAELADVCDAIGVIEQGNLVYAGTMDDLLQEERGVLRLKLRVFKNAERTANILRTIERVSDLKIDLNNLRFKYAGTEEDIPSFLQGILAQGADVTAVEFERRNLEEVFLHITQGAVA